MEIDVKSMSLADLHKLEKEIAKEKKNREGVVYKSDLELARKLAESGLKQKLIDVGVNYIPEEEGCLVSICEVWKVIFGLESSIFKICDVTLGNYQLSLSGKYGRKKLEIGKPLVNTIRCNGKAIGYTVNTEKYEAMANDICEIVKKYSD